MKRCLFTSLVLLCAVAISPRLLAHPLGFGLIELRENQLGRVTVRLRMSGTEQQGHRVGVALPRGCVAVEAMQGEDVPDGFVSRSVWRCSRGLRGETVTVTGLEGAGVQIVFRVRFASGESVERIVDDSARRVSLPRRVRASETFVRGVSLGVRHIAEGVDHLAFVLALVLWFGMTRALAVAVTGFTLGHSVTLALSVFGWLEVSQKPVEACIALSVLLVVYDVACGRPPPRRAGRAGLVTAVIGTLHGLGFAGALREQALESHGLLVTLAGFNAGVELGQLGFIAVVLAVMKGLSRAGIDQECWRRWVIDALGAGAVLLLLERVV